MPEGPDSKPAIPQKLELEETPHIAIRTWRAFRRSVERGIIPIAAAAGVAYGTAEFARQASRPYTGFDPAQLQELEEKVEGAYTAKRERGLPGQISEWLKRWKSAPKEKNVDPISETRWVLQLRLEIMKLKGNIDQGVFFGALFLTYWATSGFIRRRVSNLLSALEKSKEDKTDMEEKNEIRQTLNQLIEVINYLDQRVAVMPLTGENKHDVEQLYAAVEMLGNWAEQLSKDLDREGPPKITKE